MKFKGFICTLILDNEEIRFATYNRSVLKQCDIIGNNVYIKLSKKDYCLEIKASFKDSLLLVAPSNGCMSRNIYETIDATSSVKLYKNDILIYSDESNNCGLEIVK